MNASRPDPDAREVDRIAGLMTVAGDNDEAIDAFLLRCVRGSSWTARIRTAEVEAKVLGRVPLGTISERSCCCVRLLLNRPVPVEPGLRFLLVADDDSGIEAVGVIRPWEA